MVSTFQEAWLWIGRLFVHGSKGCVWLKRLLVMIAARSGPTIPTRLAGLSQTYGARHLCRTFSLGPLTPSPASLGPVAALAASSATALRHFHWSSWRRGHGRAGHAVSHVPRQAGRKGDSLRVQQHRRCFEGTLFQCSYRSKALGGLASPFSVYVPDAPRMQTSLPYPEDCEEFPVVLYLSDMGCSHLDVMQQTTALEHSSACGLIFLAADTSPRGDDIPDDAQVDMGIGASFYVNATEQPWAEHYRMQDYLQELLGIVHQNFPTCGPDEVSLMGHSMGGMGALATAIRMPDAFRSVSVLAPIAHPTAIPEVVEDAEGGLHLPNVRRTLSAYLGKQQAWSKYDPTQLIKDCSAEDVSHLPPLFVDVGSETMQSPLCEVYRPLDFVSACNMRGIPVELRVRAGFDHGYFFVTSVMEEHLDFHSKHLDVA